MRHLEKTKHSVPLQLTHTHMDTYIYADTTEEKLNFFILLLAIIPSLTYSVWTIKKLTREFF
jgi:ABC-type phosphate transport system permease subunit